MDFDIKQLKGDWSKWANEANEHKKGTKDDKINSAFEEAYVLNAAFNAGKTVEEVTEIFGAEFGQKYERKLTTDNGNISLKSDTAKDAEEHILSNYLAKSRAEFVKNPDWKAYAQSLKDDILSPDKHLTNRGFYTTLTKQIETVADAMSKFEYNSRDDIKDLYKKVKAELDLDKKDKFKDFKLEVLKQMVLTAEAHQKTKEKDLVEAKYDELRKTMSREEAVKTIQKSDEFKGSYFHDYWGQDSNERFSRDDTQRLHKGLIHEMEEGKVMAEARKEVNKAIEAQRRKSVDDPRSSREIEKDAKESMGDSLDKYAKKVFRGELSFKDKIAFERSNVKAKRKEIASDELAEHNKTVAYTEEDIKDELKNDIIFNGLLASGLITERDSLNEKNEKTYDISALSDKIRERIGAELVASKQKDDLYPYSEVENVVKDILVNSGVQNISTKEVKNLIELCGFEVEGKNWVKIFVNSVADTVIPTLSALAAVGLMDKQVYDKTHPVKVNVNNKVHAELDLNITGGEASINKFDLMKSLQASGFGKDNIKLTETANGFKLIIDKTDSKTHEGEPINFYEEFSKRAGETALKTALVSFALNFMSEAFADNQGEIPTTVTQFAHKSIEAYNAEIDADKKMTSAQKESLKQLAEAYLQRDEKGEVVLKDGEPVWDVENFKDCLDRMAGSSSMLNKHEHNIGINNELSRVNKELSKIIVKIAEEDKLKEQTEVITTVKNTPAPDEVLTVPHTWKHNESWQAVIATYYPEAFEEFKNNLKPLVDAFRDAQGISRRSGVPNGQTLHLDVITVNGKSYSPKADEDGARLKEFTSNKWFGWGSKFFSGDWKIPTDGVSKATSSERRITHDPTYTSTRKSDGATNTGKNERQTQEALRPELENGVKKNVKVTSSDGTSYEYKVWREKEK